MFLGSDIRAVHSISSYTLISPLSQPDLIAVVAEFISAFEEKLKSDPQSFHEYVNSVKMELSILVRSIFSARCLYESGIDDQNFELVFKIVNILFGILQNIDSKQEHHENIIDEKFWMAFSLELIQKVTILGTKYSWLISKKQTPYNFWKFFGIVLRYTSSTMVLDFHGPVEYVLELFSKLDWSGFVFKTDQYADISSWYKSNYLSSSSLKFISNSFLRFEHSFATKLDVYRYCDIVLIILSGIKGIDIDS